MSEPDRLDAIDFTYELALSIYFSSLLAGVIQVARTIWRIHMAILFFWDPRARDLPRIDYVLFYLEIYIIPAIIIFGLLQLAKRFPHRDVFLSVLGGIMAIGGLPLAIILAISHDPLAIAPYSELIVAGVCFLLWVYGKWPLSSGTNVLLLALHLSIWSLAGAGLTLSYGREWSFWRYARLIYPALGLGYTLLWARYIRQLRIANLPVAPQ